MTQLLKTVDTIRCVQLSSYGGYDKISVQQVAKPKIDKNEVLVKVKACGMNFSDLLTRQGIYTFEGIKPPFTMGLECSGIVEEVGNNVTSVKVGDRVMCWSFRYGMWAEVTKVPEVNCYPIPDSMTFEEAAAIPVQYLTAYLAILDFGHLRPGQSVLIQVAAGGVGWAATQIAKTVPEVKIFGTASAAKHDLIKANGVHYPIDYRTTDFAAEIKKIDPKGIDVVLDCLGGSDLIRSQTILKHMGRVIAIGIANMMTGEKRNLLQNLKVWWQTKNVSYLNLIQRNQSACGINISTLLHDEPERFRAGIKELVRMFSEGKIKPRIDTIVDFHDVITGTKRLVERQNIGKVILVPEKSL